MQIGGGYMGRYLRVDLSERTIEEHEVTSEMARAFLGGNGFGVKILWDEVSPSVNPLSPENVLVIATGPLVGTAWPT